jgi:hypothetical protein
MAQLGGKAIRTTIQSLEVLSDDGKQVLMFDTLESGVKIRVRQPFESPWGQHPTWVVSKADAEILAKLVGGHDAQYNTTTLAAITSSDFTGEDVRGDAIEKEVEARCSQLDIERAKAANLAEEQANLAMQLRIQHLDDKHPQDVEGCTLCENRIRPGHGDGSIPDFDYTDAANAVRQEVIDSEF